MNASPSDYLCRPAALADVAEAKVIRDNVTENRLVGGSIDAPEYERAFFVDGKAWVAVQHGRVAGFVCGRHKQADIWALFVDGAHHGRGVGRRLMDLCETWLFEQGVGEISLSTEPNTRAERFYLRRGWQDRGLLENGDRVFVLRSGDRSRSSIPTM